MADQTDTTQTPITTDTASDFKDGVIEVIRDWFVNAGFKDRKLTDTPTDDLQVVNKKYVDAILPAPGANGNLLTSNGTIWTSAASSTGSAKTLIPYPNITTSFAITIDEIATNTNMRVHQIVIPVQITVNSISIVVNTVNTAGAIRFGIFSEDGQTRHIAILTGTINSTGIQTFTVSPGVTLNPGVYYFTGQAIGTTNIDVDAFTTATANSIIALKNSVSGKAILEGNVTVTADTIPSSFNPVTDIAIGNGCMKIIRLDN